VADAAWLASGRVPVLGLVLVGRKGEEARDAVTSLPFRRMAFLWKEQGKRDTSHL